jgi:hypothetical protein
MARRAKSIGKTTKRTPARAWPLDRRSRSSFGDIAASALTPPAALPYKRATSSAGRPEGVRLLAFCGALRGDLTGGDHP